MPMVDTDIQHAIARIHATPYKMVLEFAGAGSLGLWWLHSVSGSSRTILEATDHYTPASLHSLLNETPTPIVSVETATHLARYAYNRALVLQHGNRSALLLGVGCNATIASTYNERDEHRCAIAVQSNEGITTYDLHMNKGIRDRTGEETLISILLIRAIAHACGLMISIPLPLVTGENLRENHMIFAEPLEHLMAHTIDTVTVYPDGRQIADQPIKDAILSGAFNPLHDGHIQLANVASKLLGMPVVFEMPMINADKGTLSMQEVERRLLQFKEKYTVIVSRAPLFWQKAMLFPGCTFVMGYDTAIRLLSSSYYQGDDGLHEALKEIRSAGCRLLIAGRFHHGQFHVLTDIPIPTMFHDLFIELPEELFRVDVSSTELRQHNPSHTAQQPE